MRVVQIVLFLAMRALLFGKCLFPLNLLGCVLADRLCRGSCNHVFHIHCIVRWLESNQNTGQKCPMCRADWVFRNEETEQKQQQQEEA